MEKRRRKRINCPNCDKHLKEDMNFCPNCGQENHIKRVSMKMLVSDFSSTYFSFDSKLFASLKYLLIKPSFLSLEYLDGKIEAYLRPIRLYIFISFAFFLLNSIISTGGSISDEINLTANGNLTTIEQVQSEFEKAKTVNNDKEDVAFSELDEQLFDGKITKILSDKKELKLFLLFLKSKLPILFFFLIPILGVLLFLFFYKKKYFYVDHLVFALHLQSFVFVLLIVSLLIDWVFKIDLTSFAILGLLIYGFIAARKFYALGKISTFIRLSFVGLTHVILSTIIFGFFFLIVLKYYNI
ncbi:MAG: DUF3667 domain-containing protein [Flavobacteriaceae bacterium]|nr:DUF3667 domain-containing protein [Flavobacteriaceae bacterium]